MTGLGKCSRCGTALLPDAPGGHCLRCLLQLGLEAAEQERLPGQPGNEVALIGEKPGDRIGRYKLLEQIGEGGCGVVFMAEQEEPIRRRVALKVIKLGMDTRQVMTRFEAERQALAMMDHPNIAKVLDAGATDAGRPYFVMDLVRGLKITDYCDAQKFSTQQRLGLFMQVCQAVQHAHQKGIIHRDLKPSNILVTEQDGVPVPKVIDFGVAKAMHDQLTEKTLFTAFQQFVGTPAYTSPEQAGLGGLDIDTRSDIYSLGVLLYELLTGQPPFDLTELRRSAVDDVLRMIREKEPARPSTRLTTLGAPELTAVAQRRQIEPAKLPRVLRGELDWIVMKALEKDRRRRYETTNGLAADLQRYLNGEPVNARPPSASYRLRKTVRRHKVVFLASAAVVVALLAGLAVSTWLFIRERESRKQAEVARQNEATQREAAVAASQAAEAAVIRAEGAAAQARLNLAKSDYHQAVGLAEVGRHGDAIAYLNRSLSIDRTNIAAMTKLASILASSASTTPFTVPVPLNTYYDCCAVSADCLKVFAVSNDLGQVFSLVSGAPLTAPLRHTGPDVFGQFSPDGRLLFTLSADRQARVWDANTGLPVTTPSTISNTLDAVQFSTDGAKLLTDEHFKSVWAVRSGEPLRKVTQIPDVVSEAILSPDGSRVFASSSSWVRIYDASTGSRLLQFAENVGRLYAARFSKDGKTAVTVGNPVGNDLRGPVRRWDLETGREFPNLMRVLVGESVGAICFSPDGKCLAVEIRHGISLLDLERLFVARTPLLVHSASVRSIEFSGDGKSLLTVCWDGTVRIWDATTGQLLSIIRVQDAKWAGFTPDATCIVTVAGRPPGPMTSASGILTNRYTVSLWSSTADLRQGWTTANAGNAFPMAFAHDKAVNDARFSPDGKRIVTASSDLTARVWDATSGKPLTEPMVHDSEVIYARFAHDGKQIVTFSFGNLRPPSRFRVWDSENGHLISRRYYGLSTLLAVQLGQDASREPSNSLSHSNLEVLRRTGLVQYPQRDPAADDIPEFNADGSRVLLDSGDSLQLWNTDAGELIVEFDAGRYFSTSGRFSPDGRRVLTISEGNSVQESDSGTGEFLAKLVQTKYKLSAAILSHDGSRIATISENVVRVWDAQSGLEIGEPLKHNERVVTMDFSPDGRRLLTVSGNDAYIWDLAPVEKCPSWVLLLAEAVYGRVLDDAGVLRDSKLPRFQTMNGIKGDLNRIPAEYDWIVWGRWFLADPSARTISPFSTQTVPEYVEARIKEGTMEALDDAERAASGNAFLVHRIKEARTSIK